MRDYITILFIFISCRLFGQGFIKSDTLSEYPTQISERISGSISMVRTIDFNGDNLLDYIISVVEGDDNYRYWILSDFQLIRKEKDYSEDYYFEYYVNIDDDIELEVFVASGYEDGIDYAFYDFDIHKSKKTLLFLFNPIIIVNDNYYWGYPWNIEDIILKTTDSNILKIHSSLNHNIIRDGNITFPNNQKIFPIIFFQGKKKDKPIIDSIQDSSWLTLTEIKKMITKKD